LPTKPHQREWPPAHYVAAQVGGVEGIKYFYLLLSIIKKIS